jgi:hypothetical protein
MHIYSSIQACASYSTLLRVTGPLHSLSGAPLQLLAAATAAAKGFLAAALALAAPLVLTPLLFLMPVTAGAAAALPATLLLSDTWRAARIGERDLAAAARDDVVVDVDCTEPLLLLLLCAALPPMCAPRGDTGGVSSPSVRISSTNESCFSK